MSSVGPMRYMLINSLIYRFSLGLSSSLLNNNDTYHYWPVLIHYSVLKLRPWLHISNPQFDQHLFFSCCSCALLFSLNIDLAGTKVLSASSYLILLFVRSLVWFLNEKGMSVSGEMRGNMVIKIGLLAHIWICCWVVWILLISLSAGLSS